MAHRGWAGKHKPVQTSRLVARVGGANRGVGVRRGQSLTAVEVLTAYSHTPERLHDLQKATEIVRGQGPDQPDERNEEASRPRQWSMADRLSPDEVQTIINQYRAGTTAKDLAASFGISLSSVRRLLRRHRARLRDRDSAADR